ncbi:MAG: hypothetical protein KBT11_08125 [Treponema sp.]|nr:hypothetical protein [Candidatus Treponema equifaecale]
MSSYSAFSYKAGSTFVHKIPAWCKILFIPALNIAIFSLNFKVALAFIFLQFILFCFLKFTVAEQLADLTPVIWYGVFMYLIGFFSESFMNYTQHLQPDLFSSIYIGGRKALFDVHTFSIVVKFFACTQSASLMFKTSTSLQLKEGIELIELAIRRFLPVKKEAKFAVVISMFINFIPAVFKMWTQLKRAWFARNGKNSLKMFLVLIPVLFSVGLKYAFDTTKAILNRNK